MPSHGMRTTKKAWINTLRSSPALLHGPPLPSLRALSSQRAHVNHFETMGCDHNATTTTIKLKFYARAKELHPDVARHLVPHVATSRFQELEAAYRALSDPTLRAEHLAMLEHSNIGSSEDTSAGSGPRATAWHPNRANNFGREGFRTKRGSRRQWQGSDKQHAMWERSDSFAEEVANEFRAAMDKAQHGPCFMPGSAAAAAGWTAEELFPWAFECEERAGPTKHAHIFHIVSGRQFLGFVQPCALRPLPTLGDSPLPPSAEPRQRASSAGSDGGSGDGGNGNGAGVEGGSAGIRRASSDDKLAGAASDDKKRSGAEFILELHFLGRLHAVAVCEKHSNGRAGKGGGGTISVYIDARSGDVGWPAEGDPTASSGGRDIKSNGREGPAWGQSSSGGGGCDGGSDSSGAGGAGNAAG
ncbi:unnamed protein product [Phaeothamnion confervicola]